MVKLAIPRQPEASNAVVFRRTYPSKIAGDARSQHSALRVRPALAACAGALLACTALHAQGAVTPATTLAVSGQGFTLGGRPFQIISGEMHYPRIPRESWRDRFAKARAMGLNTITTYAFWNVHEPQPGAWDFAGQNDIAEYIREAGEAGLKVILRPGPYVCAEWELGGFPAWLLKDRTLVLRSSDPKYVAAERAWFARLAQEVKPLMAVHGGPIIAVQIENEYGSFGNDRAYLEGVKQALIDSGLGEVLLYTSNPPADLEKGSLPGVPTVVNFGTGDAEKAFKVLAAKRPDGPKMTGEYWAGWFDKWGEVHHETDGRKEAAELAWMLGQGYSVSLYLFDGGTNFGWMNGADSHTGKDYHPDTTSYDYDAPIDESGRPRYKFALFQNAIAEATHVPATTLLSLPSDPPMRAFALGSIRLSASLWRNLPTPVNSELPLSFEDLGQDYGYVLYRTRIAPGQGGTLLLKGMHSYAQVYVNQRWVGSLDRRKGEETLDLPRVAEPSTLDILVENTGRVNYSHAILTEQAGLTGEVTLDGKAPRGWEMYSLPMGNVAKLRFLPEPCAGPCFYQASMITGTAADTFLDTRALHKGQLWMGPAAEHNVGRFWSAAGPQYALFLPGVWMSRGETKLWWFDLAGEAGEMPASAATRTFGTVSGDREKQ